MKTNRQIEPVSYAVIETVVCEAQDIAQIAADLDRSVGYRQHSLTEVLNERLNALLDFFLHTFGAQPEPKMVRQTFTRGHSLTISGLLDLHVDMIPLVVIRELITTHHMPLMTDRLTNWTEFSRRYNEAVN